MSARLGVLRRLVPILPSETLSMLFNSMVLPKIEYCDTVWANCGKSLSDNLQKLQNRAARLVLGLSRTSHVDNEQLSALGWYSLASRRQMHLLQTVFKSIHQQVPEYLQIFSRTSHTYSTRHNLNLSLQLPKVRLETGRRKFAYRGAFAWNGLPATVRLATSSHSFKKLVKHHC